MTPSVLRIRGICRPEILVMEKPLIIMRPAVGTTSPVSSLMMVDLPEPEGPTRKTNSPSSMVRVIPRMALVPLSYSISTFFRRIIQAPRSVVLLKNHRVNPRAQLYAKNFWRSSVRVDLISAS